LLLVNLPLLANLEKIYTCGELDCFLEAVNNTFEGDDLADEAIRDLLALL